MIVRKEKSINRSGFLDDVMVVLTFLDFIDRVISSFRKRVTAC